MNLELIVGEIHKKVKMINIKNKPNLTVSDKYPYWTIGITDDLDRRKQEHKETDKNVTDWIGWSADTEIIARAVEKHFLKNGMKGGTGGGKNPSFVYIF